MQTGEAHPDADSPSYQLHGRLVDLGEGEAVEAGFEFRLRRLLTDAADEWRQTNRQNLQSTGCRVRIETGEAWCRSDFLQEVELRPTSRRP